MSQGSVSRCSRLSSPIPAAVLPQRSAAEALTGGLSLLAAEFSRRRSLSRRPFRNTCLGELPHKSTCLRTAQFISAFMTPTLLAWKVCSDLVATLAKKVMRDKFPGRESRSWSRFS